MKELLYSLILSLSWIKNEVKRVFIFINFIFFYFILGFFLAINQVVFRLNQIGYIESICTRFNFKFRLNKESNKKIIRLI